MKFLDDDVVYDVFFMWWMELFFVKWVVGCVDCRDRLGLVD